MERYESSSEAQSPSPLLCSIRLMPKWRRQREERSAELYLLHASQFTMWVLPPGGQTWPDNRIVNKSIPRPFREQVSNIFIMGHMSIKLFPRGLPYLVYMHHCWMKKRRISLWNWVTDMLLCSNLKKDSCLWLTVYMPSHPILALCFWGLMIHFTVNWHLAMTAANMGSGKHWKSVKLGSSLVSPPGLFQ